MTMLSVGLDCYDMDLRMESLSYLEFCGMGHSGVIITDEANSSGVWEFWELIPSWSTSFGISMIDLQMFIDWQIIDDWSLFSNVLFVVERVCRCFEALRIDTLID